MPLFVQENSVLSLVKINPVFLKWKIQRFQQVINVFSISFLSSPPGKGQGPAFERIWNPFTQGCSVPSLVEVNLVHVSLEKKTSYTFINALLYFIKYHTFHMILRPEQHRYLPAWPWSLFEVWPWMCRHLPSRALTQTPPPSPCSRFSLLSH